MSYVQLALAVLQILKWITDQISKAQWEASGKAKAYLEMSEGINASVSKAIAVRKEVDGMSEKEIDEILKS